MHVLAVNLALPLMIVMAIQSPLASAGSVSDAQQKVGATLHSKISLAIEDVPLGAMALIKSSFPGFQADEVEQESKHGNVYLDIEGQLAGKETEFDLLQTPDGWKIVEVQRDIEWLALPEQVAVEFSEKQPGPKPARIIESVQYGTAITIYELYFVDTAGVESKQEIKFEDGMAELLEAEWQH